MSTKELKQLKELLNKFNKTTYNILNTTDVIIEIESILQKRERFLKKTNNKLK